MKEGRCPSEPSAIARSIRHKSRRIEHVGLETGGLSQWLFEGLTKEGFSVSVMEARHVRAAFAAMRVKTDRNDARGIAQLVRLAWFNVWMPPLVQGAFGRLEHVIGCFHVSGLKLRR